MHITWIIRGALEQTTGGYLYDRIVIERLRDGGDEIRVLETEEGDRGTQETRDALAAPCSDTDVVVADELCHPQLAGAFLKVQRATRAPCVLLVHHLTSWERPRDLMTRARELACLHACDAVITTSPTTGHRVAAFAPLSRPARRAHVAPPGADRLPVVQRTRRDEDEPALLVRLLFIATLTPRKRLLDLLDALDHIAAPHARLDAIGPPRDAAYASAVRARIARSPYLAARITLHGELDDLALAAHLANADALVLPSSLEGYGIVLAEALHAGVPILASRASVAHAPDLLTEGREALLFDSCTIHAQLCHFLVDPALRARLRAAAQTRAHSGTLPRWRDTTVAFRDALTHATLMRTPRAPRTRP